MERTIAAISTPQGNGGIAVIRISGNDAVKVADKVFFGSKKLADCDTHTVHYGFIKNEKGEKVDEVLATVMLAPKTFTREDVVEISTHGGSTASRAVTIDYPDEDLEDITTDDIRNVAHDCKNRVNKLLSTADSGKILRDGIKTVIVGKPNVGKSSLLNSLAREERAIVTDIAGTTRDVIEEYINLDGIPLMLIDTAGIRNTDDTVEKIGVEKSIKSIEKADLVVVMIDGSGFFGDEDVEVLHATKNKKRIVLINKTDLGQSKYVEAVKAKANGSVVIEVSAKTGMGLDILADEIRKVYNFGELAREDSAVITNMRHKTALIKAGEALGRVVEAIDMNMPSDIASIDINIAIDALGEITGETVSDDIVTAIFHSFCVGK